jgi:hypothetical protein
VKHSNWTTTSACFLAFILAGAGVLWHWKAGAPKPPLQSARAARNPALQGSGLTNSGATGPTKAPESAGLQHSTNALSPLIATAVGQSDGRDFASRLDAVSRLGSHLSLEKRAALYSYLRNSSEENWLRPGQSFALKNDILNKLREQATPPQELTSVLLKLFGDESQPLVMRDYALQHLAPWYSRVDAPQQKQILEQLRAASNETTQTYAGTALLALDRLARENPEADLPPFSNGVLRLIEDATANLLARITAVQLSGHIGLAEAQHAVEAIVGDHGQPKTLRIAAVAALGGFRGNEAHALLLTAARGFDEPLKVAAVSALNRQSSLEKR